MGAIWSLLPLRLGDGQLLWGRDMRIDDTRYRVDIETRTEIALRTGRQITRGRSSAVSYLKAGQPLRLGIIQAPLARSVLSETLVCRMLHFWKPLSTASFSRSRETGPSSDEVP